MSLLMDALKKAEEEKKRAAKRLEELGSTLESYPDKTLSNTQQIQNELTAEKNDFVRSTDELKKAELSLEPITSETEKPPLKQSQQSLDDANGDLDINDDFNSSLIDDITNEHPNVDEFIARHKNSVASDNTVIEDLSSDDDSAPFEKRFDGTETLEDTIEGDAFEETLPGLPVQELAKDLGEKSFSTTPAAAETIFNAGQSKRKNNVYYWGIFFTLILLAIISFSVFYYFTITPVTRLIPSPSVAKGIESTPQPIQQPVVTPPGSNKVSGTIIDKDNGSAENNVASVEIDIVPSEVEINDNSATLKSEQLPEQTSNEEEALIQALDKAVLEVDAAAVAEKSEITQTSNTNNIVSPLTTQSEKEISVADTSLFSISKSKDSKQRDSLTQEAFKAYQAGHYDAAKSLYSSVVEKEPDARDARLGLAAIAIRENNPSLAYKHYAELLKRDPQDTIATNAMLAIIKSSNPIEDESSVKLLLQKSGDYSFLHFSLGNIYARQNRWVDAQQSFFKAYSLESSNPDYAYNLAVSLDQIGQQQPALNYYRVALQLNDKSNANFDIAKLQRRIATLSSGTANQ